MDTRYQIEEMVSQDANGVVFQGMDSVTGVIVAMRRFISSGCGEGHIGEAEQQGFIDAIAVLKKITHPSLRRALAGGCDPVDNMPYLVTRWVDGDSLGEAVETHGALDSGFARHVLGQFLDANAAVSEALGREGIWLEAALESIMVKTARNESESPVALFWLCPLSWLHTSGSAGDIMALADLAEAMLGGPRKVSTGSADDELAKWLKRIRSKEITSLQEAKESLIVPESVANPFVSTAVKEEPPEAASSTPEPKEAGHVKEVTHSGFDDAPGLNISPAPRPLTTARGMLPSAPDERKRISPAVIGAAVAVLGGIIFVSWIAMGGDNEDSVEADESPLTKLTSPGQARPDDGMPQIGSGNSANEERRQHVLRRGYYTINEADLLLGQDAQEVTLRGRLARVRMSSSGLTMYLEFSEEPPNEEPRAYAMARNLVDGIRSDDLEQFVGRQIEIRGPVDIEDVLGTRRPRVKIIDRDHINVLAPADDFELR